MDMLLKQQSDSPARLLNVWMGQTSFKERYNKRDIKSEKESQDSCTNFENYGEPLSVLHIRENFV